jgi:tripartite-type tricarboxylate transporter receptor subunit TctC
MLRKLALFVCALACAGFAGGGVASAQFGVGPVRIVLPFSPGGTVDVMARLIAERIQSTTGKPATVENITGASGHLGIRAVKDATPDGSVLLFNPSSPMTLHQHFFGDRLIFDPFRDFAPISLAVNFDYAVGVARSVPATSVKELVAWLKEDSRRANYGTPGAGALSHFLGLEFGRIVGVPMTHVPYRGSPPALNDLVAGQIQMAFLNTAELAPHHNAGAIRIVGTFTRGPSPFVAGVPTMKEQGIDIEALGWYALYAPAKTPPATVAALNRIVVDLVRDPEMKTKLFKMGMNAVGSSPEELAAVQRRDSDFWGPIVKASGWKPDL